MEQYVVAYHANCNDGFTAAAMAILGLRTKPFEVKIIEVPLSYNKETDNEVSRLIDIKHRYGERVDKIYILDFSLTIEGYRKLHQAYPDISIHTLDHHKGAKDTLIEARELFNCTYQYSEDISGAMMAYMYFNPTEANAKRIAEFASDWDTWTKELEYVNEFTAGLKAYALTRTPFEFADDIACHRISANRLIEVGEEMLAIEGVKIEDHMRRATPCTINNVQAVACNCSDLGLASQLGHDLHTAHNTPYSLVWTVIRDDLIKCSLRSKDEFDCIPLANLYGGGGHKNAAGFTCTFSELINMLDNVRIHSERN